MVEGDEWTQSSQERFFDSVYMSAIYICHFREEVGRWLGAACTAWV